MFYARTRQAFSILDCEHVSWGVNVFIERVISENFVILLWNDEFCMWGELFCFYIIPINFFDENMRFFEILVLRYVTFTWCSSVFFKKTLFSRYFVTFYNYFSVCNILSYPDFTFYRTFIGNRFTYRHISYTLQYRPTLLESLKSFVQLKIQIKQ